MHYSLLVIGENIEEQLAPFAEDLQVPRYVRDTKEEIIASYRHCHPEFAHVADNRIHQLAITDYQDNEIAPCGGIYSIDNPNGKWDSWKIGGIFYDKLVCKDLICRDSARLKDIAIWTEINDTTKHLDTKASYQAYRQWNVVVNGDTPRQKHEREWLKGRNREWYLETYQTKHAFVTTKTTFWTNDVLKDGIWYELEDEKDTVEWVRNYYDRFIKGLPDDTLLTVVDYHI
jgi:hypothetical protein